MVPTEPGNYHLLVSSDNLTVTGDYQVGDWVHEDEFTILEGTRDELEEVRSELTEGYLDTLHLYRTCADAARDLREEEEEGDV